MGRRKIDISKIEDDKSRHTTFYKRRAGLIKKAAELAVLCDLHLFLVFDDPSGNFIKYQSHPTHTLLDHFSHGSAKHQIHSFCSEDYPVFSTKKKSKNHQGKSSTPSDSTPKETLIEELNVLLASKVTTPNTQSLLKKRKINIDLKPKLQVKIPDTSGMVEDQMNVIKALNDLSLPTNSTIPPQISPKNEGLSPLTNSSEHTHMDESGAVNSQRDEEIKTDMRMRDDQTLRFSAFAQLIQQPHELMSRSEKNLLTSSAGGFKELQTLMSSGGFFSREPAFNHHMKGFFGLHNQFMLNAPSEDDPFQFS